MNLKKGICLILTFITVLFVLTVPSFAASFSVSASNQSLNIGESATLTINASDCLGQFTISSSNPGVVSVGNSSVWAENGSQSISVTAVSAGSATITVTATNVSDSSGDNMVTGSKTVNITVKAPAPVNQR